VFTPGDNFNTVLYTGDGTSSNAITGVGFEPNLTWIKNRSSSSNNHALFDSVRGIQRELRSDTTDAEIDYTATNYSLKSFDIDGFTVGDVTAGNYNVNGAVGGTYSGNAEFVAWSWKAGGAARNNTDGSVASLVSANTAAGFSIVSTQSDGSGYLNFGHGLSQAPELVITKFTSQTGQWYTYTSAISNGFDVALKLNSADAAITAYGANKWSSTDSVVGVGNPQWYFTANVPFITYCFHSVAGYSKIGSYTGNGSATGPIVTLGFEPAWIMIKRTDGTGGAWSMFDNKRSPSNPVQNVLQAQDSAAEANVGNACNFNSNDFQLTDTNDQRNANGGTYIFMAFATNPT
tara:strand:- start:10 stop:1050 length:1041 start_codon:yes stop_codon:yes gene_type:complete